MKKWILLFSLFICSVSYAADTKLTALSAASSAESADVFYIATSTAGTPVSNKITTANLLAATHSTIKIQSATGVTISSGLKGQVTFAGVGNTNNENIIIDMESTANTIGLNSTTGSNTLDVNQWTIQGAYTPVSLITTLASTTGSVTPAKSGFTYVLKATGQVGRYVLLLPTASTGQNYTFVTATGTTLDVKAGANDKFVYNFMTNGQKITSPASSGSTVEVIGDTNLWYIGRMSGNWSPSGS